MWTHVAIYDFISHENMTHIALRLFCKFPQHLALGHCVAFLAVMNYTVHHELWWLLVHRCLSWTVIILLWNHDLIIELFQTLHNFLTKCFHVITAFYATFCPLKRFLIFHFFKSKHDYAFTEQMVSLILFSPNNVKNSLSWPMALKGHIVIQLWINRARLEKIA